MKKVIAAYLVGCAGCIASGACAQEEEFPITSGRVVYVPPDVPPVFSGRSVVRVWGTNESDFRGYNTAVPPPRAANDFDFAGGPAGSVIGSVAITSAYFGVVVPATSTDISCEARVSLFSTFGGWVGGTFPGTDLVGQASAIVTPGGFCDPGPCIPAVVFDPPVQVQNIAGTDGIMMIELFVVGTNALHPTLWAPATLGTSLVIGSSDTQRWGDATGPGGLVGQMGWCSL